MIVIVIVIVIVSYNCLNIIYKNIILYYNNEYTYSKTE